ncbi:spermidine/putrescine ABC transporter substrate-binding protein [Chloroflexus sp. Y-396-1]|uniref:polyamine ABC transporter substrate-binding protein n=1 Tax=Chloroflexus sp. Y-396-1 TaxID=867845 RepID=UPI0004AEF61A|nr:spermidine/putrescine ABC transporter substrate-binding protein [Chloroflexus sp. Y-396-1]
MLSELRLLDSYSTSDLPVFNTFSAETGIAITSHLYSTSEEAYRFLTTTDQAYDVIIVSDTLVHRLRREQRLAVLNHAQLPNLVHLDPMFAKSNGDPDYRFCVPYRWSVLGFGYRQSATGRAINNWDDVFDPAYPDRIGVPDEARLSMGMALIKSGFSPNSSDPAAIAAARNWWLSVAHQINRFTTSNEQELLQRDELDIVVARSGDILQIARDDADIRFTIPEEGSILITDSLCVPANAVHQSIAEQLINFVLTPEHSAALANMSRYGTPNQAALPLIDAELRASLNQYIAQEQAGLLFHLTDVDPAVLELYRAAWTEVQP